MSDRIEATTVLAGGAVQPGYCGFIERDNGDGTVNVVFTHNNNCADIPAIPVPFVNESTLIPCHCDG